MCCRSAARFSIASAVCSSAAFAHWTSLAGALAECRDLDPVLARQRAEPAARVLRDVDVDTSAFRALAGAEALRLVLADHFSQARRTDRGPHRNQRRCVRVMMQPPDA